MSDEVYFTGSICGPEVHGEDIERRIDLTASTQTFSSGSCIREGRATPQTHLMSTSFPVVASLTTSLTHGGGVIGRRSCGNPLARGLFQHHESSPYLVPKTTHPSPDGLLLHFQTVDAISITSTRLRLRRLLLLEALNQAVVVWRGRLLRRGRR